MTTAASPEFDVLVEWIRRTEDSPEPPAENPAGEQNPFSDAGSELDPKVELVLREAEQEQLAARSADERAGDPGIAAVRSPWPAETGYWNPAVVTGPDGKATVKIVLPDRATDWTLTAKGLTRETLVGETTADLATRKQLFGQLQLPAVFTDGDQTEVLALIHNRSLAKGTIEAVLTTRIGSGTQQEKRTLQVTAPGVQELRFPLSLRIPDADAGGLAERPRSAGLRPRRKAPVRRGSPTPPKPPTAGLPRFRRPGGRPRGSVRRPATTARLGETRPRGGK